MQVYLNLFARSQNTIEIPLAQIQAQSYGRNSTTEDLLEFNRNLFTIVS
jgi:hypothetical protein